MKKVLLSVVVSGFLVGSLSAGIEVVKSDSDTDGLKSHTFINAGGAGEGKLTSLNSNWNLVSQKFEDEFSTDIICNSSDSVKTIFAYNEDTKWSSAYCGVNSFTVKPKDGLWINMEKADSVYLGEGGDSTISILPLSSQKALYPNGDVIAFDAEIMGDNQPLKVELEIIPNQDLALMPIDWSEYLKESKLFLQEGTNQVLVKKVSVYGNRIIIEGSENITLPPKEMSRFVIAFKAKDFSQSTSDSKISFKIKLVSVNGEVINSVSNREIQIITGQAPVVLESVDKSENTILLGGDGAFVYPFNILNLGDGRRVKNLYVEIVNSSGEVLSQEQARGFAEQFYLYKSDKISPVQSAMAQGGVTTFERINLSENDGGKFYLKSKPPVYGLNYVGIIGEYYLRARADVEGLNGNITEVVIDSLSKKISTVATKAEIDLSAFDVLQDGKNTFTLAISSKKSQNTSSEGTYHISTYINELYLKAESVRVGVQISDLKLTKIDGSTVDIRLSPTAQPLQEAETIENGVFDFEDQPQIYSGETKFFKIEFIANGIESGDDVKFTAIAKTNFDDKNLDFSVIQRVFSLGTE